MLERLEKVTEEMLRVRGADGPETPERQGLEVRQRTVVREAILTAAQLADEGLRVGVRRRAAQGAVPHMCDVEAGDQPLIAFEEMGVLTGLPATWLLDHGQRA